MWAHRLIVIAILWVLRLGPSESVDEEGLDGGHCKVSGTTSEDRVMAEVRNWMDRCKVIRGPATTARGPPPLQGQRLQVKGLTQDHEDHDHDHSVDSRRLFNVVDCRQSRTATWNYRFRSGRVSRKSAAGSGSQGRATDPAFSGKGTLEFGGGLSGGKGFNQGLRNKVCLELRPDLAAGAGSAPMVRISGTFDAGTGLPVDGGAVQVTFKNGTMLTGNTVSGGVLDGVVRVFVRRRPPAEEQSNGSNKNKTNDDDSKHLHTLTKLVKFKDGWPHNDHQEWMFLKNESLLLKAKGGQRSTLIINKVDPESNLWQNTAASQPQQGHLCAQGQGRGNEGAPLAISGIFDEEQQLLTGAELVTLTSAKETSDDDDDGGCGFLQIVTAVRKSPWTLLNKTVSFDIAKMAWVNQYSVRLSRFFAQFRTNPHTTTSTMFATFKGAFLARVKAGQKVRQGGRHHRRRPSKVLEIVGRGSFGKRSHLEVTTPFSLQEVVKVGLIQNGKVFEEGQVSGRSPLVRLEVLSEDWTHGSLVELLEKPATSVVSGNNVSSSEQGRPQQVKVKGDHDDDDDDWFLTLKETPSYESSNLVLMSVDAVLDDADKQHPRLRDGQVVRLHMTDGSMVEGLTWDGLFEGPVFYWSPSRRFSDNHVKSPSMVANIIELVKMGGDGDDGDAADGDGGDKVEDVDKDNSATYRGKALALVCTYRTGLPEGPCWERLVGGGHYFRNVSSAGAGQVPVNLFRGFPAGSPACPEDNFHETVHFEGPSSNFAGGVLHGRSCGTAMEVARKATLVGVETSPSDNSGVPSPTVRSETGSLAYHGVDLARGSSASGMATADPVEAEVVQVGPSTHASSKQMGLGIGSQGLYAAKNVSAGTTLAFFGGMVLNRSRWEGMLSSTDQGPVLLERVFWMPVDSLDQDSDVVYLPPPATLGYAASLGHKIMHSFLRYNCRFLPTFHPRFGHRIPAAVATEDVRAGQEILCHYNWPYHVAPGWYQQLWRVQLDDDLEDDPMGSRAPTSDRIERSGRKLGPWISDPKIYAQFHDYATQVLRLQDVS